jgi:two-component system sensor histidine kinase VicK
MSDETDASRELAMMLDSIEESIISTTVDGIVLTMNQSAERMFGYTARELIGSSISVLTPLDRRDHEKQVFDRVRRGERFEFYETQRLKKDARVIDVALTLLPHRDALGHVVGIVNIARDLVDRKRLEQAERDQFLLASLISSADDAIVSKNLDGIVTTWNRSAEKLFGYTAEEMI